MPSSALDYRLAVANARIGNLLDLAPSTEEVGVHKPHVKVYQLAADRRSTALM